MFKSGSALHARTTTYSASTSPLLIQSRMPICSIRRDLLSHDETSRLEEIGAELGPSWLKVYKPQGASRRCYNLIGLAQQVVVPPSLVRPF